MQRIQITKRHAALPRETSKFRSHPVNMLFDMHCCLQNTLLEDQIQEKDRALQQLQDDLNAVSLELKAQTALHAEFEQKVAGEATAAEQEIKSLRDQVEQLAMSKRSTRDQCTINRTLTAPEELEEELDAAERTINLLTAEKNQLLKAYERLEEDTGRMIDEAVAKQQSRVAELVTQIQVS
jgi:chromosome segregation ATPase